MADKKASTAQLDFTNVKEGGNFNKKHQPAGDYRARIKSVVDAQKKDDKDVKMWLWTIEVGTGTYPYYTTRTAENQLWKIRNLWIAAGINVPKKRVALDPNKLVGKDIGVTLEDEEYEGKMQSSIASTFPTSELDGDAPADAEDEEETEEEDEAAEEAAPPKEKKSKKDKGKKSKGEDPVEAPQASKKDKKKKAKPTEAVADDELEELEIEDL